MSALALVLPALESIQPSQGTVFSLYCELSGQKIYLEGSDSMFNGKAFISDSGIMLFSWQELPDSWPSSSCWLSTALTPKSDTSVWRINGHVKSGLQNTGEEQSIHKSSVTLITPQYLVEYCSLGQWHSNT